MHIHLNPSIRHLAAYVEKKISNSFSWIAQHLLSVYQTLHTCAASGVNTLQKAGNKTVSWVNTSTGIVTVTGYHTVQSIQEGAKKLKTATYQTTKWSYTQCETTAHRIYQAVGFYSLWTNEKIGIIAGSITYTVYPTAEHTARFVKENWRLIIAYTLAWTVVIACNGFHYGFSAVALPMTIGFGVGFGFGGFVGIIIATAIDRDKKWQNPIPTGWNYLDGWINDIDENGTRRIMLALAVPVVLAVMYAFPYVFGGVLGALVGNQTTTKIGYRANLGGAEEDQKQQIKALTEKAKEKDEQVQALTDRVDHLEALIKKNIQRTF